MADPGVTGVHHIGIVVDDLEDARRLLGGRFGFAEVGRVEREDLNAVFLACGSVRLELIEVTDADARAARLGDRAAVIEHIAFSVRDLETTLEALDALGIGLKAPPSTSLGSRTAFTDSATSDGVMYQFVEEPEAT